jgi:hypothetical protein
MRVFKAKMDKSYTIWRRSGGQYVLFLAYGTTLSKETRFRPSETGFLHREGPKNQKKGLKSQKSLFLSQKNTFSYIRTIAVT